MGEHPGSNTLPVGPLVYFSLLRFNGATPQ